MKALLPLVAILGLMVSACGTTYDPYYYDYTYYDPYYYGYDAWMTYTWVDPYGVYYFSAHPLANAAIDVNAAAQAIAQRAPTYFTPSGCVTATASGATVTYSFSNCNGGLGMNSINGGMTVALADTNGQLTMNGASNNLTVNGNPYTLNLKVVATQAGTQRSATITSTGTSTNQLQTRQEQGTITWTQGSGCIMANGSGSSSRSGLTSTSTLTSYQRCDSKCPTSGTETVQTSHGTFTATFNGTSTLTVKAPNGGTKTYNLQCTP